ncbi:hypothetical protein D8674_016569 [Pyrus ussuriensis x Pyrus communis]|uniref:Geraniol 8-hydroxylase-like n=1 Tax=Pyrus ussuriensis x Pyrus communis TaxID=2448454 RepID=A0A5N5HA67_9ROSA|nr:hypothetical protein D8674_016569 [Pyrus ussuriensis x Pyrus communis]
MDILSCILLGLMVAWISIYILYYSLGRRSSVTTRLPPGPNPLPLIGNLLELGNKPHLSLTKLSQRYGPVMALQLGQITTVVISSSTVAKEVFRTHDQLFCNRTVPDAVQACDHAKYGMAWKPELVWGIVEEIGKPNLADYFPVLKKIDPMGIRRRLANHFQKMISLFDRMITQRLESRKSRDYVTTKDMLDTLINFSEEKSKDMDMAETEHLFLKPSDCTQSFHFYFLEKPK